MSAAIPGDFANVATQYSNFLNSSIVGGTMTWIIGISLGAYALYALLQAVRK